MDHISGMQNFATLVASLQAGQNRILERLYTMDMRLDGVQLSGEQYAEKTEALKEDLHVVKIDYAKKLEVLNFKAHFPATWRFVETLELLEMTLLFLPMRSLLRAQRVSKHFNALMENSISIQRALFFEPAPLTHDGRFVKPIMHPILAKRTKGSKKPKSIPLMKDVEDVAVTFEVDSVEAVDDNDNDDDQDDDDDDDTNEDWVSDGVVPTYKVIVNLRYIKHAVRDNRISEFCTCFPEGSWRKMLVSQPPCPVKWRVLPEGSVETLTDITTFGEMCAEENYIEGKPTMPYDLKKKRAIARWSS